MLTNKWSCGALAPQVEAKASTLQSHFVDVVRPFKVVQEEGTMGNYARTRLKPRTTRLI